MKTQNNLIYIAEPDSLMGEEMVSALASALKGYNIKLFSNGDSLNKCCHEERPDLIITEDVDLPELTGFEIVYRLRRLPGHIPIIMVSSRTENAGYAEAFDYVFMKKPLDINELKQQAERLLNESH